MSMLQDSPSSGGMFNGNPKTMFFMGLFVGVSSVTTVALALIVGLVLSGKSLGTPSAVAANTQQVAAAPTPTPTPTPTPSAPVKPVDEKKDHILGPKDAKVTLIEYSDFECPFCKRHFDTVQQVVKDYPKDVRIVFRHFPLSFHQNAQKEAEASECVAKLGGNDAFWKFHDKIFKETTSNGTGFALDKLGPAAAEAGVNQAAFQKCLDSGEMATLVAQQQQEGGDAGVQGTPATYVNGSLVEGAVPYATMKAAIDAALKG